MDRLKTIPRSAWLLAILLMLAACEIVPRVPASSPSPLPPAPTPLPTAPAGPQLNPLSGLEVVDPALLKVPAVLISISHFPATARPQAGLSFAPFVYEFYITEGATRFLTVFHGEWPAPEIPITGGCDPRVQPLSHSARLLGNRVWLDADRDGLQEPGEVGISGLCVKLLNDKGELLTSTATDTNGFYGFDVQPGQYIVEFESPSDLRFIQAHAGAESIDSDADPHSGRAQVDLQDDDLNLDAGLVLITGDAPPADETSGMPLAQVGPIRSGRLIYRYLARTFQNSCLIFAYASPEVLSRLPQCAVVFHQIQGGGYMLDLDELWTVARNNQRNSKGELDYGSYKFGDAILEDSRRADELHVYTSYQNQSGWTYDPISQSYLRSVDTSRIEEAGILHPETDRLTGRRLTVQNVIVMFAKHDVVSPTNLDIRLDPGRSGKAVLFRDGRSLNIDWLNPRDDESGAGRPLQFLQKNGEPVPLRPGHTWVIVVTPESSLESVAEGHWRLTFVPPEGAR